MLSRWGRRSTEELGRVRTEQSFCVPREEIAAQAYDLSLSRYKQNVADDVEHRPALELISELERFEDKIRSGLGDLRELLS